MKKLLVFFTLVPLRLCAMQEVDRTLCTHPVNTYQDEPLTPSTILDHAPQLPAEDAASVRSWLSEHPELVTRIIAQERIYHSLQEVGAAHRENFEWLAAQNIINHARSNYILDDPTGRYVIKIAGEHNRLCKQLVGHGIPPYHIIGPIDDVLSELHPAATYQTISYIPVYLRYLELQRLRPLRHIVVPATYLVPVPGQAEELSDKNHVIAQAKIVHEFQFKHDELRISDDDYAQLNSNMRLHVDEARARLAALSPEQLYELILLTFYCGLWNFNTNLYATADGKLGFNDLEEPNTAPETTSDGRTAFYLQDVHPAAEPPVLFTRLASQNKLKGVQCNWPPHAIAFGQERYRRNVEAGINELYNLFPPDSPQALLIKTYANLLLPNIIATSA